MFKVVPDQLRISDGWVRCGHCGEVFDAADHLQDESQPAVAAFATTGQQQPAPPPLAPPSPPPAFPATPSTDAWASPPVFVATPQLPEPNGVEPWAPLTDAPATTLPGHDMERAAPDAWNSAPPTEPAETQATAWQALAPMPDSGRRSTLDTRTDAPGPEVEHDEILGIPLPAVVPAPSDDVEPTLPLPLAPATPVTADPAIDPVDEFMQEAIAGLPSSGLEPLSVDSLQPSPPSIEQELAAWTADRRPMADDLASAPAPMQTRPQELEFVREAQRKAFWRRPVVRGGLWLAGLVLASALAAQWAVHDRDRIAAFEPRARPALEWLCSFSGCRIAAFKQIESISIDSSSFSKTRDNLYLLNVVIKNSARVDLAMPSIELTLTDSQDQTLLRRVLTPAELGAPAQLTASGDWSAALPVSVAVNGIASRVAGYRVLAFYP